MPQLKTSKRARNLQAERRFGLALFFLDKVFHKRRSVTPGASFSGDVFGQP